MERGTIRSLDRTEWTVGRIAESDQVGAVAVGGEPKDLAGERLILHGGVATTDAEIGWREQHAHRRLPEVVLDRVAGLFIGGSYERDGRGR